MGTWVYAYTLGKLEGRERGYSIDYNPYYNNAFEISFRSKTCSY